MTVTAEPRDVQTSVPSAARVAVATAFVCLGAGGGSWATRIPAVQHRLGLSAAELGLALFGLGFGSLLSMPLTGVAIARRGSRPVMHATWLGFAVAAALPGFAWNLPTLWVALTLFGAASGALDVAMNAHGVAVEHAYGRPILSSLHAAFSAGALLGAAIGGLAAGLGVDVRVQLTLVAAAIAIAGIASGRALLPADADRGAAGQPLVLRLPRQLAALGAIAFLSLFCEGAASDWSAVYLAGPLDAGADVAAAAFGGFAAAMMLGRIGGDRLVTRLGEVTVVRAGAALAAGAIALGLLIGSPVAGIIAFTCLGAGVAGIVPIVFRAAATHPDIAPGIGLAAVSSAGYTGFLVGPPVIGTVASVTSLPRSLGLIVLAAATMSALAGYTRVTPRSRAPTG